MTEEREKASRLGSELRALMQEHSLSMRKLSELTGIQTATISRIVNGKQKAKLEHIELFSKTLQVPVNKLLEAAGVIELEAGKAAAEHVAIVEMLEDALQFTELINYNLIIPRIQEELDRYERYALTEEGQQLIRNQFAAKAQQVDGMGPYIDHLMDMYRQYADAEKSEEAEQIRATIGSVLLYFILSTDVIPDYIFPIGYLDDAIAVKLGLNRLQEKRLTLS
ncbi:DUF1232 domain-containing protein [Paenibacillus sp. GCM10027626]|uniref:DUF1232 domain-containing protein n=1 Tax=Paenibacillus sp. GCM10027626 TaxID=3273411 RepID=UPI003635C0D2